MTIDSVAITKNAVLNTDTNVIRIPSTAQSGAVALTVRANPIAARVVQCGVPLFESSVSSASELVVKNELGQEIPAQFDILTTWPDGSIKVVLITCSVAASASATKLYSLEYGAGVTQSSYSTNLSLTTSATEYTIDTGKIRVVLDRDTGALIKSVHADTAGNQTYSTQVLGASELASVDALDDTEYLASNETAPTWAVLRNGAMNVQLRAVGYLRDNSNNTYTQFRVWIDLFNDSDEIGIEYCMVDDRQSDTNQSIDIFTIDSSLASKSIVWTFNHSLASNHKYIFGGENFNSTGDLTQEEYIFQSGYWGINGAGRVTADPNGTGDDATGNSQTYSGIQSGNRAKGFASCHNGTVGVSTIMRNFWQLWPNELSMDTSATKIHLHPDKFNAGTATVRYSTDGLLRRPNTVFNSSPGIAKTYQMKLIVHSATPVADTLDNITDNFNNQLPELLCTAEHYCTTKFLYDLIPNESAKALFHSTLLDNVLRKSRTEHPEREEPYGWRDWGDRYRHGYEDQVSSDGGETSYRISGFYNGAHIGAVNYYILFFETLESEWLHQGEIETRHFMDQDVNHGEVIGRPKPAEFSPWPAGNVRLIKHSNVEHGARYTHEGHTHLSGLLPYHWLTGNQRAFEVAQEIGTHYEFRAPADYRLPRSVTYSSDGLTRGLVETERDFGWPFFVMLNWVKLSNDAAYFNDVCTRVMQFLVDWWQTPDDHYQADVIVGRSDYQQGTGYWLLDEMDNGINGTHSNGTQPWMAGSIFHACIEWLNLDERYNTGIDRQEVRNMLYQCMQFVMDWGLRPDQTNFWYSEVRQSDSSGARLLMDPFSQLYLWYKEDLAASRITNPEWFDHALWKTVILNNYTYLKQTGYSSNRFGFYGYELIFPNTFWRLAKIIEAE